MTTHTETSSQHIIPVRTYLLVFAVLLILTAVTVAASYVNLGGFNVVLALLIAGTKAALVALIFMHLLYDNKIYLIILLTAIGFLTIFISFTMFDTMRRGDIYQFREGVINQNAVIYDEDGHVIKQDSH